MRSSYIIAGGIAVAAVLWFTVGPLLREPSQEAVAAPSAESPASAAAASTAPQAETATPFRVQILDSNASERDRTVILRGRTEANRIVQISAQTYGQVESVTAEKGVRIEEDAVIATLQRGDRIAKLDQARAELLQRQTELKATTALSAKGYSPKLNMSDLNAKLALAQANVASMTIEIGYLTIRAPIDGVLESRDVETGHYLQVGDPVAKIVDLDPIILVGSVPETEVAGLKLGGKATARLITGDTVIGTVRYIASSADETTRTFRVEIAVPNAAYTVRDGISAEIAIPVSAEPAHVVSPEALTLSETGEIGIKIVGDDNKVAFVPVTIVGEDAQGAWLTGLPAHARIITVGQEFVIAGQVVEPVAVPAAQP